MSIERRMRGRVHYGWIVVAVTFVTLLAAAGIRSAPGVLMIPLEPSSGGRARPCRSRSLYVGGQR